MNMLLYVGTRKLRKLNPINYQSRAAQVKAMFGFSKVYIPLVTLLILASVVPGAYVR